MGHYQRGCDTYIELSGAMFLNLEAPVESRSLLRRFFTQGWGAVPGIVDEAGAVHLANEAGNALAVAVSYRKRQRRTAPRSRLTYDAATGTRYVTI
jgi:hypothetical protein